MREFTAENYYILQASEKDKLIDKSKGRVNGTLYIAATLDRNGHETNSFEEKVVIQSVTPEELGSVLSGFIKEKSVEIRIPKLDKVVGKLHVTMNSVSYEVGGIDKDEETRFWNGYWGADVGD